MQIGRDASFEEFYQAVISKFKVASMTIKYKDEDGDMVCMTDQGDYELSLECVEPGGKLQVWCEVP